MSIFAYRISLNEVRGHYILCTENKQKLPFSNPPPLTSAYVIYEWSLSICMSFILLGRQALQWKKSVKNSHLTVWPQPI